LRPTGLGEKGKAKETGRCFAKVAAFLQKSAAKTFALPKRE
jgi:hypothetical protein